MRILIYLAAHPDKPVNTAQVSQAYDISKNHLVRVVQTLCKAGFIKATAGRTGGIKLAMAPADINLGEVFRATEPRARLVECFEPETNTCPIAGICGLRGILREAGEAFEHVMDKYTLADVVDRHHSRFALHFLPGSVLA